MFNDGSILWAAKIILKNEFIILLLMVITSILFSFLSRLRYGTDKVKQSNYLQFSFAIITPHILLIIIIFLFLISFLGWNYYPTSEQIILLFNNFKFFRILEFLPIVGFLFSAIFLLYVFPRNQNNSILTPEVSLKIILIHIVIGLICIITINHFYLNIFDTCYEYKEMIKIFHEMTFQSKLFYIIGITIIVPLIEEFFFRGALQTKLINIIPVKLSIIVQSLIFAAAHINLHLFLLFFLNGAVYGIIFQRTKSVIITAIIHIVYNSYALIISVTTITA